MRSGKPPGKPRGLERIGALREAFEKQREEREAKAPEVAAATADLLAAAEARRHAAFAGHLLACNVPPREVEVLTGGGLNRQHPALGEVGRWARGPKTFCVLWGPNGTGKTVAAASALWWACKVLHTYPHTAAERPVELLELSARAGLFVSAFELRHMAQKEWQAKQDGSVSFERALEVPWLVVDELGHEGEDARGEWKARLRELVNARYSKRLKTALTTNCCPGERRHPYPSLAEWMGPAVADRVDSDGVLVPVEGASLRGVALPPVRLVKTGGST